MYIFTSNFKYTNRSQLFPTDFMSSAEMKNLSFFFFFSVPFFLYMNISRFIEKSVSELSALLLLLAW